MRGLWRRLLCWLFGCPPAIPNVEFYVNVATFHCPRCGKNWVLDFAD